MREYDETTVKAATDVAAAYLSFNPVPVAEVGEVVTAILSAFVGAGEEPSPAYEPAVDPRRSIKRDRIISLIDGKGYKMLKRHLTTHGLTPDEYRARYNLPSDYPMVARDYADTRRALAKRIGLGRMAKTPRAKARKVAMAD